MLRYYVDGDSFYDTKSYDTLIGLFEIGKELMRVTCRVLEGRTLINYSIMMNCCGCVVRSLILRRAKHRS